MAQNKDLDIEIEDVKPEVKKTKKRKKKKLKFQDDNYSKTKNILAILFCLLSAAFIIFLIVFYSIRFMTAYKEERNPEQENMQFYKYLTRVSNIVSSDDGLYYENEEYVYKGNNVNNYVLYNGEIYRVMRITKDKKVKIVSDKVMLSFPFEESNYMNSRINKELNNLYPNLTSKTNYCIGEVPEIKTITCPEQVELTVGTISLLDYTLSGSTKSYLNNGEAWWLSNSFDDQLLYVNIEGLITNSNLDDNEEKGIRPVISLETNIKLESGYGTKEEPFILK